MKIIKKRNNGIVGWRVDIEEYVIHIDPTDKKVVSTVYQKRKYITLFGREFKIFDWRYDRKSELIDNVTSVGFKNK